jgi:hypothetical protein
MDRPVAVVGVGTTVQMRDAGGRNGLSFALEALQRALDDAGLTERDLQGVFPLVDGWPNLADPPGN